MLVKDPVCEMPVDPRKVKNKCQDTNGAIYYFCSAECKSLFEKETDKFRK